MITYYADAVKVPELTIYPHAVRIRPLGSYPTRPPKDISLKNLRSYKGDGGKDGKIKGFSAHAMSRLRTALCKAQHRESACCYGLCLTIPWGRPGCPGCPGQDVAGLVWREFQHNLSRLVDLLRLGAIYRVELQQRKTTHWHIVAWLPVDLDAAEMARLFAKSCLSKTWRKLPCSCSPVPEAKRRDGHAMLDTADNDVPDSVRMAHQYALLLLRMAWMRACVRVHVNINDAAPIRSWDYCLNAIPCRDMSAAYSYLASHSSKHKQEQLGYVGKQWGYIGQKWLKEADGDTVQGFETHMCKSRRAVAFRLIRRWISKHRSASLSRLVTPRRHMVDGFELYTGLSVRNFHYLNLFGVPPSVILQALDIADATPCRLARGCVPRGTNVKQSV